ncbi:uncharacterized protein LOC110977934 [Acanthaster planci]|uniref:Uncharacterized protein LOC110977934 n=1 Tax=Acanthaster planci TaxID=133434 RepID=A0A8B7Y8V3_ACAPL|nr:uncharacterized protein LOC110977934 [Acanthaster planci]XP_022088172.1 uncharacterized protein LOC110977934 [Acanthaster planci]
MVDLVGLWIGTGVLCAVIVLLMIFAIYKQHFGTLSLPPRKPEAASAAPAANNAAQDQGAAEQGEDAAVAQNSAVPVSSAPPPYPANGPAAYVYEQPVSDSADVEVEVHGEKKPCTPEPEGPHVYEQAIQLETST